LLVALAILTMACGASYAQNSLPLSVPSDKKIESPELDPLVTLNNAFRTEYGRARTNALSKVGPLIIVEGNDVVLLKNGQRTTAEILPPIYHSLKAIAHIPFAVFLIFEQLGTGTLTDARIAELQEYRKLIVAAQDSIGKRGFSDAQMQRQRQIIVESLDFFDAVIRRGSLKRNELEGFAKQVSSMLLANVDEAAKVELGALHLYVTNWRHQMSPEEWKNLPVPQGGAVYVFRNRSATALKLLLYDGQGYWLMMKRLSQGRFAWWPQTLDARVPLSARELIILIWNGDPERAQMAQDWRRVA